jgi:transposase
MNQKLYSTEQASKLSDLGIKTIKKLIEIRAVIPVNDNLISSFGLERLKKISELLEQGYSKREIIKELDEYE